VEVAVAVEELDWFRVVVGVVGEVWWREKAVEERVACGWTPFCSCSGNWW